MRDMVRRNFVFPLFLFGTVATLLAASGFAWGDEPWKIGPLTNGKVALTRGTDIFEISFPAENIVELHLMPGGKGGTPTPVMAGFTGSVTPTVAPAGAANEPAVLSTPKMSVSVAASGPDVRISDASGKLLCKLGDWQPNHFVLKHDHHSFLGNVGDIRAGYQGSNGGPFFWTLSGYGVLWDCDHGSVVTDDTNVVVQSFTDSGILRPDLDCYVIVGAPRDVLAGFADLTGHAPMFPKWSLGYMVSRWGIDEKEELANVDLFRQKKIPFDTYIIDYDWFNYGKGELGDFEWNTDHFPDGPSGKLCKELLASKGVKMVGIRKPRLSAPLPSKVVDEAQAKGWILPHVNGADDKAKEFDFHNKEADDWWWAHEKPAFESGLAGYWNDEADVAGNFHFLEMARTEYEGQRGISNQRVWTLNRNFLLGSQRYAYALWSGDISTGFPSMADQRPRMLQAIDGGEAWWSMDTGGFAGPMPTPESYTRWIQFATFVPIMRCHAAIPQKREPWNYGDQAEAVSKKYIELRYRLLPYLYSGAWQISQHGLPMVRPMWIDYSDDPNINTQMKDQWMVGDFLLARPIVDQGAKSARVYLPKGTWIDYWTGQLSSGGQWTERAVNADTWEDMPLFVKRGAIIPTAPPMLYVGQVPIDPLTVEIYPDTTASTFTYYDDDGQTYDYEKGVYAEISMQCRMTDKGIAFEIGAQKGSYPLPTKSCRLNFHLLDDKRKAQGVTIHGQALAHADSPAALDAANQGWTESSDASGPLVIVKSAMGPQRIDVALGAR